MSCSVRARLGFREDLRVREMTGRVGVAPGGGGAVGVDLG